MEQIFEIKKELSTCALRGLLVYNIQTIASSLYIPVTMLFRHSKSALAKSLVKVEVDI